MLLSFFEWCEGLAISQAYSDSTYLFPLTQALHVLAVTVFVGAIVVGDLRLLGWGPVGQSRASIARSAVVQSSPSSHVKPRTIEGMQAVSRPYCGSAPSFGPPTEPM